MPPRWYRGAHISATDDAGSRIGLELQAEADPVRGALPDAAPPRRAQFYRITDTRQPGTAITFRFTDCRVGTGNPECPGAEVVTSEIRVRLSDAAPLPARLGTIAVQPDREEVWECPRYEGDEARFDPTWSCDAWTVQRSATLVLSLDPSFQPWVELQEVETSFPYRPTEPADVEAYSLGRTGTREVTSPDNGRTRRTFRVSAACGAPGPLKIRFSAALPGVQEVYAAEAPLALACSESTMRRLLLARTFASLLDHLRRGYWLLPVAIGAVVVLRRRGRSA
jgi:hypothetical protein